MVRLAACFVLMFALVLPATAQDPAFSSLEERMSAKEFREAGLDKLSDQELSRLNAWLRDEMGARAAYAPPADLRGLPQPGDDGEAIVSTIEGKFKGWRGSDTLFRLANGQVWQQAEAGTFAVNLDSPTVRIKPGLLGSWYLSVEGYNTQVKVKRIR